MPVSNFLAKRRNRVVGSILGYAEREIFPHLSESQAEAFRHVVRDATNSYHDSVLDLVKAEDGTVRNDEVVALLERLERRFTYQERTSNGR